MEKQPTETYRQRFCGAYLSGCIKQQVPATHEGLEPRLFYLH